MKKIYRYTMLLMCACLSLTSNVFAADWDIDLTGIGQDPNGTVSSGAIIEIDVEIENRDEDAFYDDIDGMLNVTFSSGLKYTGEGTHFEGGASSISLTNVSTGSLSWNIGSFPGNSNLDKTILRFFLQGVYFGGGTQFENITAMYTPGPGAPVESDTGNNTKSRTIQVKNSIVDGACGYGSGGIFYSGYTFPGTNELCAEGVVISPGVVESTSGFNWTCTSFDGSGDAASCVAGVRYCGDAVNDPEEACDDGNADNTDGCLDTCELATCGDTFVQTGVETCDDGNSDNTDGCTNVCEAPSCGDGFTYFGPDGLPNTNDLGEEACDDANSIEDDGCNISCEVTTNGQCGDVINMDIYDFDGNGDQLGSGASDLCTGSVMTGFIYSGTNAHAWEWMCLGSTNGGSDISCSVGELYCGDGEDTGAGGAESCDDGNTESTDGCNEMCETTYNGVCGLAVDAPIYNFAGDGSVLTSGSMSLCGGSSLATGFVYSGAIHEWTWDCLGSPNGGSDTLGCIAQEAYCGDGEDTGAGGAESCDDGNTESIDGCNEMCETTFNGQCGNAITADIYDVDAGGNALTLGSENLCLGAGVAVDNFVYSGTLHEWTWDCLGSPNGGSNAFCTTEETYCGDGIINLGSSETCDFGDIDNNDGCSSICEWEIPTCTLDITPGTGLAPLPVTATQMYPTWAVVDTMNWDNGITDTQTSHTYITTGSFLATLTIENVYNGAITNQCTDLVQVSVECGNGLLEIGEICDDGNKLSGDGCNDSCREEICGDGIVNNSGTEECDDGNTNTNDACPIDCQFAVCGDGIKEGVETCDDGNTVSDDGCSNVCVSEGPPPSRKGNTAAKAKFLAATSSVISEDESIDVGVGFIKPNTIKSNRSESEEHNSASQTTTFNASNIFAYLKQRNLTIIRVLQKRKAYFTQMNMLYPTLQARNEVKQVQAHTAAPVSTEKKVTTKKAAMQAALMEYLKNK